MPLHEKNNLLDDVYASSELKKGLSKTKFPQEEQEAIGAYQLVHDEIMLDGNARQNLATFCSAPRFSLLAESLSSRDTHKPATQMTAQHVYGWQGLIHT